MTDTNDIVERLREGSYYIADDELTNEAADLIEQLQAKDEISYGLIKHYEQRIAELEAMLVVCGVDPEDLEDKE